MKLVSKEIHAYILSKPYNLFLIIGFLWLVGSFFTYYSAIEIQLHDNYIVIDFLVCLFFASVFFMVWVVYRFTKVKFWTVYLVWMHVLFTLAAFILVIMGIGYGNNFSESYNFNSLELIYQLYQGGIVLFVVGQLSFVINLIIGLLFQVINASVR
ncbi:hypothetical protein Solca_2125 [Solitalea canadensis DSM 3403]|uniref:Uncharacterized protein n=1 Tax=Solitalea canadensis (strain ATCC 29591 / DSM 3403 / JCM 21819 / LMG 8368 / NBRC 15130 / NCIMB 12057 / USAM 9D) TaxID=929556 RepID=H8KU67_SOLCM|nr:hypothetical protein Solca_2125 [Solitalea canadensis DSM 3403]